MAKHLFIVIILAMGVFFFLGVVFQILHHRKKTEIHYICNLCGEHDCICNKVTKSNDSPPTQAKSPKGMFEKEG